jgi:hypothetical protein
MISLLSLSAMLCTTSTVQDQTILALDLLISQPIFITATVGSVNQHSIVFTDAGLMFQSDKGIWLLGRNGISVEFIGAPVEPLTKTALVNSAVSIPGTTQVKFTLDSGITLMYDYFFGQWAEDTVDVISSTLYNNLHTVLDKYGNIYQETPGLYLDGNSPVLMQFTTSWFNLAGLQGYQRIYEFQMLASYVSPHKLYCTVAYNHQNPTQQKYSLLQIISLVFMEAIVSMDKHLHMADLVL